MPPSTAASREDGSDPDAPPRRPRGRRVRLDELEAGICDVAKAARGILLQASAYQAREGKRRLPKPAPVRIAFENCRQGVGRRGTAERLTTGEHLVEHASERPDVRSLVDRQTASLLGTHVRRRAEHHSAARRQPRYRRRIRRDFILDHLGQAEVEHFQAQIRRDGDVRGLQIPVDDAALMGRIERIRELPGDPEGLLDAQRPAHQAIRERLALDQLEDDPANPPTLLDPMDRRDVRVVQRGQRAGLPLEAGEPIRIGRPHGGQDVDGDVTPQPSVTGTIHVAHAAGADERDDLVDAESGAGGKVLDWGLRGDSIADSLACVSRRRASDTPERPARTMNLER